MSELYTDLTETNFPQAVDTFNRVTDVTLDLLPLVQEYQSLYANGKINEAASLLAENPSLQNCMINAKTINRCYDGIKALQRFYMSDIQKYIEQLITYRGDYSATSSYQKYDVCLYNGSAYLCISNASIGILPSNQDYFIQITLKGDTGKPGLGLSFLGQWDSNTLYPKDACVTYNNVLYASTQDENLSRTPSLTSQYWNVIFSLSEATSFDNSNTTTTQTTMQGALDELYSLTKTNTTNISTNKTNIASNTSAINAINSALSTKQNASTAITTSNIGSQSVNYATSSGTANYAIGAETASNSDAVDGYHFTISTTDLTAGTSTLTTNTFCFVYE